METPCCLRSRRTSPHTPSCNSVRVQVLDAKTDRWVWRRDVFQVLVLLYLLSPASASPTVVPTVHVSTSEDTTISAEGYTHQRMSPVLTQTANPETPRLPSNVFHQSMQAIDPPFFQRSPDNKTAVLGGRVTFKCQPEGEGLHIVWQKDKGPLQSNRYIVKSNNNLRITNISAVDRGKYRCCASNAGGTKCSEPAFLEVQIPVRIVSVSQRVNVSYGTMVNLTCLVEGNPKPVVTWSKNRDLIKDWSTRPATALMKEFYSFNATASENYTCTAVNKMKPPNAKEQLKVQTLEHTVRVYNIPNYCARYRGQICSDFLSDQRVFVDATFYNPLNVQEPMLGSLSKEIDLLVKGGPCNRAFKSLMCHSMLPGCQDTRPVQPKPICREDCLVVNDLCSHDLRQLNKSTNTLLLSRLRPLLSALQCRQLPSKESNPGTCSIAKIIEMREDLITRDCVRNGGQYYQGKTNITNTGLTCQPWTSSYPQSMHMFTSVYPELVNSSNYCRNPGGIYRGPGCFPVGENPKWQPCRIPSCDARAITTKTSASTVIKTDGGNSATDTVHGRPFPKEPNNKRSTYLICGGAAIGVCLIFIVIVVALCRRYKLNRYSAYKYPGDLDVTKLPENPMYGKDFNKSFNPHLRHLEYPRNNIIYVIDIGEGAFGRVFKGIAPTLMQNEPSTAVAVKMLKANADRNVQEYFNREAEIISRFSHANVIKLLGVCFVGKPLCLLLEYMAHGDLQEFLHRHSPDRSPQTETRGTRGLNNWMQLNIAFQVACGMVYLTEKRFVHRDIATRNCLVGKNNDVKISDFGLARYLGSSDHYLGHKDETIPIRWTAPEALWHFKFTTYSDVWSFGVLLWEIFSFAKQPYEDMTHEEVFLMTSKGHKLDCPERTPRCAYELIQMCCSQDLSARPSFSVIRDTLEAIQDTVVI